MKSSAAGFSKDRVSELFNLLERIVEHKVNVTRIYAYNVDETPLTFKKTGKVIWRNGTSQVWSI
jgi:hypothetical protein